MECPKCGYSSRNDRDEEEDLFALVTEFYNGLRIDNTEYGGIGIDSKRPFGNSDVEGDMLRIIGWEPENVEGDPEYTEEQFEYVRELYHEKLIPFLQNQWDRFMNLLD